MSSKSKYHVEYEEALKIKPGEVIDLYFDTEKERLYFTMVLRNKAKRKKVYLTTASYKNLLRITGIYNDKS